MYTETIKKLHPVAQLAVIPVLGALSLVFLPLIGFVLLGEMVVKRVAEGLGTLFLAAPQPNPGEAYLTGTETKAGSSDALRSLKEEVETARRSPPSA